MDRRILALWTASALTLANLVGCGGSQSPPPATSAAPQSSSTAPQAAQTHRPIIVGQDPTDPREMTPPDGGSPAVALTPGSAPQSIAPPPAAALHAEHAINPLRIEPNRGGGGPNPLREGEPAPRMAVRPADDGARPPLPPEFAEPGATVPTTPGPTSPAPQALSATPSPAAAPAPATSITPPAGPYEVVQVFYGTDRQAAEPLANDWRTETVRFLPTIGSGLLSLCLALVALHRRKLGFWMLVFGGVGVTLGLGLQATNSTITAIRQEGKSGLWYTTERSPGNRIELGQCEVTIPRSHVAGELEAPSMLRLEVRENAAQHVVLRKTERLAEAAFYDLLKQRVNASPRKELFVFVHGFNVSFEDAARRTAQIHFDLHFEGAPVFFSWPAHDKFVLTYPADESSVATSAPHLKQFLLEIVKHTEARSINLIAHSMGNRALGIALREIDLELRKEAKLFNQVILAAPDIDAEDFRANIAPAMQRTAQRLTLYASSRDDALLASQLLHRGPRAGDAGSGLVVIPGIDTIDVTAIDSSPWGHSYYGSSDPVLHDLKALFLQATPAEDRTWLSPAERNGLTYWIFQPTRLAGEQPSPR